ncbi:MAG: hypothetical protein IJT66_06640, partial [Clostridia bacterium]|nr:hypothetical protein [Clostridia bacterium]
MKRFFAAIGCALFYFILYLSTRFAVVRGFYFILSFQHFESRDQLVSILSVFSTAEIIVSGVIAVLLVMILCKIRKRSFKSIVFLRRFRR